MNKHQMPVYETEFGKIFLNTTPFCKGCRNFVPRANLSWVGDHAKTPVYDEAHEPIYDGTVIRCEHMFMCQQLRRKLKEKMSDGSI